MKFIKLHEDTHKHSCGRACMKISSLGYDLKEGQCWTAISAGHKLKSNYLASLVQKGWWWMEEVNESCSVTSMGVSQHKTEGEWMSESHKDTFPKIPRKNEGFENVFSICFRPKRGRNWKTHLHPPFKPAPITDTLNLRIFVQHYSADTIPSLHMASNRFIHIIVSTFYSILDSNSSMQL